MRRVWLGGKLVGEVDGLSAHTERAFMFHCPKLDGLYVRDKLDRNPRLTDKQTVFMQGVPRVAMLLTSIHKPKHKQYNSSHTCLRPAVKRLIQVSVFQSWRGRQCISHGAPETFTNHSWSIRIIISPQIPLSRVQTLGGTLENCLE